MRNEIVLTGGDGFIGTHFSKHLITQGYEVYDVIMEDSPFRGRLAGLEHVHIIEGHLNDWAVIKERLPAEPSAFFHFAWAGVSPEQRNDIDYQMKNVVLSCNAARIAAAIRAKKFVFPGSTMEYIYYGKPIDKDAVPSPNNAYGVAKIAARYACSIICRELKTPFIYSVISGIYSEDRTDSNVIYYTIDKLLKGEKPLLSKLEQLWDYVHIDDVVYALRLIAEKGKDNAFYAIGHGDNWPLSEYIYRIRDLINPNLPLGIGEVPYIDGRLPCSCVNLNSIYADTGYVPQISFESGIQRVIEEIKKRKQETR